MNEILLPTAAKQDEILQKIKETKQSLSQKTKILFNTAGTHTWECPDNVEEILITMVGGSGGGGGGGGGGYNGHPSKYLATHGGGGGGGAIGAFVFRFPYTPTPNKEYIITVGDGGDGGSGGANATADQNVAKAGSNGQAGGATSFDNIITVPGGNGGGSGGGGYSSTATSTSSMTSSSGGGGGSKTIFYQSIHDLLINAATKGTGSGNGGPSSAPGGKGMSSSVFPSIIGGDGGNGGANTIFYQTGYTATSGTKGSAGFVLIEY